MTRNHDLTSCLTGKQLPFLARRETGFEFELQKAMVTQRTLGGKFLTAVSWQMACHIWICQRKLDSRKHLLFFKCKLPYPMPHTSFNILGENFIDLIDSSRLTAIGSTEGAVEKFLVSDVFKELPITRSVLHGFG
jgi:hypothetical protein